MAEAYLVQDEADSINITLGADAAPGKVLVLGSIIGVIPGAETRLNGSTAGATVQGIFRFTKKANDTGTYGTVWYWDDTNKYATTTATSNTKIGVGVQGTVAAADATVEVLLNPFR